VFVPDSRADNVTGRWCVKAAGAGDVLRVVRVRNRYECNNLVKLPSIAYETVLSRTCL